MDESITTTDIEPLIISSIDNDILNIEIDDKKEPVLDKIKDWLKEKVYVESLLNRSLVAEMLRAIFMLRARSHALAVWHRSAPPPSLRSLGGQTRSAPRNIYFSSLDTYNNA